MRFIKPNFHSLQHNERKLNIKVWWWWWWWRCYRLNLRHSCSSGGRSLLFLKVSPVKAKSPSNAHRNCKLFICDRAITKVIKKLLRPIFDQACSMLNIEQHKISDHDNDGSDYEQDAHCRHPVSAAPAAYFFLPSHIDMIPNISLLIMFAFKQLYPGFFILFRLAAFRHIGVRISAW